MEEFEQQEMHNEAPQEINQPQQEEYTNAPQNNSIDWGGDIKRFFTEDLKDMLLAIIKRPATGALKWLDETKSKSIVMPICMTVLSFVLVTFLSFLIAKIKIPSLYMSVLGLKFSTFLALGTMPIFFAIFVAGAMFGLFAIKKNPDFILAIRHAGVHVFLFTLAVVVMLVTMLIFGTSKIGILIMALVAICAISMGFSIARNAINKYEAENKEGFSWYVAPLAVIVALWLAYTIASAMMPSSMLSMLL